MQRRFATAVFGSFVMGSLAILGGCGGDSGNVTVQDSPAAKEATAQGIEAMRGAMQSKSKPGKSAAKSAEKPAEKPAVKP